MIINSEEFKLKHWVRIAPLQLPQRPGLKYVIFSNSRDNLIDVLIEVSLRIE